MRGIELRRRTCAAGQFSRFGARQKRKQALQISWADHPGSCRTP